MNAKLAKLLTEFEKSGEEFVIDNMNVSLVKWSVNGQMVNLRVKDDDMEIHSIDHTKEQIAELFLQDSTKSRAMEIISRKRSEPEEPRTPAINTEGEEKHTIDYLRRELINNIESIKTGKLKPERAKEITNHVQAIINITKLELEYHKLIKNKEVKFLENK